jgi:hypothetical protein
MLNIRQVLSRRSDLSTFLVHLTREYPEGTSPKENLKSILIGETVEARNPYERLFISSTEARSIAQVWTHKKLCVLQKLLWSMSS